ncbi:hypothetical protein [Lactococcus lactis]|uniref:ABC-type spermidine/putrescine transport systems, ATPase components n=1 Tax=Lactococcus lactis subsp. lactis TaxID=1360 RepID=A0A0B8QQL8_LACLL|nr:hypothetical protein [Lactococcus lactis]KST81876.1 hypothetical protein ATCC19435_1644 [Lactococcus lactis subsp. lactis]MBU3885595.1 hypothetical protein [Lactococcus lactis]MCT3121145.1 hypothetical protein [Lactococcus lactis]MDX6023815.1 hypothetical protein [Lactococcus lactis subsp. lactis]PCS16305.1 hypothetical protein RU91_GL000521 [Lactococcus lactis subsp. lactis]
MAVKISDNKRDLFFTRISELADEIIELPDKLKIISKEMGEFSGNSWGKVGAVDLEGTPYELKISGFGESKLNLTKLMFQDIETNQIVKSLALKQGKNGAYIAGFDLRISADYLKTLLK